MSDAGVFLCLPQGRKAGPPLAAERLRLFLRESWRSPLAPEAMYSQGSQSGARTPSMAQRGPGSSGGSSDVPARIHSCKTCTQLTAIQVACRPWTPFFATYYKAFDEDGAVLVRQQQVGARVAPTLPPALCYRLISEVMDDVSLTAGCGRGRMRAGRRRSRRGTRFMLPSRRLVTQQALRKTGSGGRPPPAAAASPSTA